MLSNYDLYKDNVSFLEKSDDKAFDNQYLSKCDQTMVGFVQSYNGQ